MKQQSFSFPSATGTCDIQARRFRPDDGTEIRAVLVIHHGMAEHMDRYLETIEALCGAGIAVLMHDMAGHGRSLRPGTPSGWFGESGGADALVEDFRTLVLQARKDFPREKLIVMGHSMGSFICRLYCARYASDPFDGAVYMGTGGPNPLAGAGKTMARLIGSLKGKTHKSAFLNKMAFGKYNERFEGRTAFDWLTRDQAIVNRYVADPGCGFLFTVQGMADLVTVNSESNTDAWFAAIKKDLPVLLISGEEDPVGDYGKGIRAVEQKLKETGHTAVTTILYPDARHEVLNETNRDQVRADLIRWILAV